jgi:mono/diheme cytochrome c family protein
MVCALAALVFVFEVAVSGQDQANPSATAAPAASEQERLVARGEYLAHHVAMCVQCHSPKDETGNVIKSKEFQGAPIPLSNPFPKGRPWAGNAPALPTMVHNREEAVFHLLTTGIWGPSGEAPLLPMPPFRMSDDDARAVIAYLKTR